jgi:hypothetical protein
MHAAEPARAHEPDSGRAADAERPADGRGADSALDRARGEIPCADLARACVEALELLSREPDTNLAVEHADCRRDRARLAHAPFGLETDRDAFASREPVGDQCRLERNDGFRSADLLGDDDHCVSSRSRKGTLRFRCRPVTRNPARS